MAKPVFALTVFVLMFLISVLPLTDLAVSVIPGWHTTIFPPYMITGIFMRVSLLIVVLLYLLLVRDNQKISRLFQIIHVLLCLPAIVIFRFKELLLSYCGVENSSEMMQFIITSILIFGIMQVVFLLHFFRLIKR